MARHVADTSSPSITDSTTAGAEMAAPVDMPRDSRKSSAVKLRVFASKRRSRYS